MKCWNLIKEDNKRAPIGDLLGDPDEFKSYIMFGTGVTCEIVVASSDSGTIVWDVDSEYNPGVRLYFDGSKMAKDGILIRDGIHWKVKSKFSYKDYLLFEVTKELIDKNKLVWTPKQFTLQADNLFRQTIENKY